MKRSRLRPISAKRRRRDARYKAAREAVWERSHGACEAGVAPDCVGTCQQVHHIAGRGGPDPHRLENLLGCCARCHEAVHSHPEMAYAERLMVRRTLSAKEADR